MTVLNANEIGYYDLNKKIVECDDNDITVVPYCLSALFAYRRACAELQFLQPHLPSVTEYGQSFSVLSEQVHLLSLIHI